MRNQIAVIGCPRSGTAYTAALLRAHGLDVGHEFWGRDGISSWQVVADDSFYNANVTYVHQVRSPLKVVSSLQTISKTSWDWLFWKMNLKMPDDLVQRGMIVYVTWNEMAARKSIGTYKVERIEATIVDICAKSRVLRGKAKELPPKTVNSRPHRELTWDDLLIADYGLAGQVSDLGFSYGYGKR